MEIEIKPQPMCKYCGRPIKLLKHGRAEQWTHADWTGRTCSTKYAEPVDEGKDKH